MKKTTFTTPLLFGMIVAGVCFLRQEAQADRENNLLKDWPRLR